MTEYRYWDCNRCGRNNKEDKDLEIFNVVATPAPALTTPIPGVAAATTTGDITPSTTLPISFDLCNNCLKEILDEWGRNLLSK